MRSASFIFPVAFLALMLLGSGKTMGQYQVNNNAVQTSCNCYRLTPAQNGQNGSVWNVNLIDLNVAFDFTFDVFLGCNGGGADGMAFVLQPLSVNAGSSGGGIGYQGISPSVAVEMDTYGNATDPGFDHIAIQTNGVVTHGGANTLAGPVQTSATSVDVEDCQWHLLRISWDPATQTMNVWFDGVLRLTYTGDIINNVFGGNAMVYWGFTAATGGANNLHEFCNALNPSFEVQGTSQCVGTPTAFSSTSVVATGTITAYQWDFGDGNTSTEAEPSHTYANPGDYTVTLTITSEGCTETSTGTVTITPSPVVNVGPDVDICVGDGVQVTPTDIDPNATYSWTPTTDVSDPNVADPMFTPSETTIYTLTMSDANGCSGSDELTITVNPLPVADAGEDQSFCTGEAVTLTASGGTTYQWTPTDGLPAPNAATTQASPDATTTYAVLVTDANGCQFSDDVTVAVNTPPNVVAGPDVERCAGETAQLIADGAVSYVWTPAAGLNNANIQNPVFTSDVTTTFTVTGTDANGCESTDEVTVTANPLPEAIIQPIPDACLDNPSFIGENSVGDGLTYSWTLGDGTISSDAFIAHTYDAVGSYDVTLDITDGNGCTSSTGATATVIDVPEVSMNIANAPDFCEQELISFQNTSPGNPAGISWNFAYQPGLPTQPGFSSSQSNPQFTYNTAGTYNVRLLILSSAGCSNEAIETISVHAKPTADFGFTVACEGEVTAFTDQSTVSGNTVVNGWQWTLGDGSPIGYDPAPVHPYAEADEYEVQLIVQTDQGCRDTSVQNVWVNPTPVIDITGTDVCIGEETQFTNNSAPQDATILSWSWLFGDGDSESLVQPSHTYAAHGDYSVQLTAETDSGCVASGSTSVSVYPEPEPAFAVVNSEGCEPHTAQFVNNSIIASGGIATYGWEFGDGGNGQQASMSYLYEDTIGTFDVTLTTVSNQGCEASVTVDDAVTVHVTPVADFTQSTMNTSVIKPFVNFTDRSQHTLIYEWDFGNGTYSGQQNPTATYMEPGEYDISLIAINGDCSDRMESKITVAPIFTFYIPNAFTPNANGRNDQFRGSGEGYTDYRMMIYDRWGTRLFESGSDALGWDGTYRGKGVPNGLYIYHFVVTDWSGEEHNYHGAVSLIR